MYLNVEYKNKIRALGCNPRSSTSSSKAQDVEILDHLDGYSMAQGGVTLGLVMRIPKVLDVEILGHLL